MKSKMFKWILIFVFVIVVFGSLVFLSPVIITKIGERFYKSGNYSNALKYFNMAIRINPKYDDAWVGIGNIYIVAGDLEKAIECFDKAISFNPKSSKALYYKGFTLIKMGYLENDVAKKEELLNKGVETVNKAIERKKRK